MKTHEKHSIFIPVSDTLMKKQFEAYFDSNLFHLYSLLEVKANLDNSLGKIIEYIGSYEILLKSKKIILQKIEAKKLVTIKNWDYYILQVCVNIARNNSRKQYLKNYLHTNNSLIEYDSNYHSPHIINIKDTINLSILEKSKFDLEYIIKYVEKMYSSLSIGDIQKCLELTKYFKKLIHKQNSLQYKTFMEALLYSFKGSLFFNLGKLKISEKYTSKAVTLFKKTKESFGIAFLFNSLNIYGMIKINQNFQKAGMNIFNKNIKELSYLEKKENSYEIRKMKKQSELFAFMFMGNTNVSESNHLITKVLQEDELNIDHLMDSYAKAYLFIDHNQDDRAIEILNREISNISATSNPLSRIRMYSAYTEALLINFKNKNSSDLSKALEYLTFAKRENATYNNIFFSGLLKILEGYILGNNIMAIKGLNILKKHNYIHYYNWYKKKLKQS